MECEYKHKCCRSSSPEAFHALYVFSTRRISCLRLIFRVRFQSDTLLSNSHPPQELVTSLPLRQLEYYFVICLSTHLFTRPNQETCSALIQKVCLTRPRSRNKPVSQANEYGVKEAGHKYISWCRVLNVWPELAKDKRIQNSMQNQACGTVRVLLLLLKQSYERHQQWRYMTSHRPGHVPSANSNSNVLLEHSYPNWKQSSLRYLEWWTTEGSR